MLGYLVSMGHFWKLQILVYWIFDSLSPAFYPYFFALPPEMMHKLRNCPCINFCIIKRFFPQTNSSHTYLSYCLRPFCLRPSTPFALLSSKTLKKTWVDSLRPSSMKIASKAGYFCTSSCSNARHKAKYIFVNFQSSLKDTLQKTLHLSKSQSKGVLCYVTHNA